MKTTFQRKLAVEFLVSIISSINRLLLFEISVIMTQS